MNLWNMHRRLTRLLRRIVPEKRLRGDMRPRRKGLVVDGLGAFLHFLVAILELITVIIRPI